MYSSSPAEPSTATPGGMQSGQQLKLRSSPKHAGLLAGQQPADWLCDDGKASLKELASRLVLISGAADR